MNIITAQDTAGNSAANTRDRHSVASRRRILLLHRAVFFRAWDANFPQHDVVTLRLKNPMPPNWWDESWKSAARTYHEDRKRNGDSTPLPPPSCRTFELKVEWHDQQQRQNDPEFQRLQRLSDESVLLDRAWQELNRPDRFPTPQVTIEAIWECIRERGLDALNEPKNKQRLESCDGRARAELARRIEKFGGYK
jgi:hypothetical protein